MQKPDPLLIERIRWKTISNYFLEILNLERGLGYTTKKFILDPYAAAREYLFEDRRRMIKPFSFLLLMTGLTTFVVMQSIQNNPELQQEGSLLFLPPELSATIISRILELVNQYTNLFYMATIPLVSLASYWIFRRSRLYFTEHLVLNTYLYCIQSFFLLLMPFIINSLALSLSIMFAHYAYYIYAYTRIFQEKFWPGVLKSLGVIFLSQLLSTIILALVVIIILWLN